MGGGCSTGGGSGVGPWSSGGSSTGDRCAAGRDASFDDGLNIAAGADDHFSCNPHETVVLRRRRTIACIGPVSLHAID
jgi:hypothetical protein